MQLLRLRIFILNFQLIILEVLMLMLFAVTFNLTVYVQFCMFCLLLLLIWLYMFNFICFVCCLLFFYFIFIPNFTHSHNSFIQSLSDRLWRNVQASPNIVITPPTSAEVGTYFINLERMKGTVSLSICELNNLLKVIHGVV